MTIRGLRWFVLASGGMFSLVQATLTFSESSEAKAFQFVMSWLFLGWLTWLVCNWNMSQPNPPGVATARDDGDFLTILLGWPLFWIVAAILTLSFFGWVIVESLLPKKRD